jgi:salicylate 5-hydroxylase large subunit
MNAPEHGPAHPPEAAGIAPLDWHERGISRVPYRIYADPALHEEELKRFFYSGHWCYAALSCEIPEPGDFKRTWIGSRQVIVVRDTDGSVNVVENHCAHRGAQFCQKDHGRVSEFICPYHQWSYDLKGNLQGVPFLRGVRNEGKVQGGMPKDFRREDHGLTKLKVEEWNGVVWASFDHTLGSVRDYLGPEVAPWYERVFNGRKLTLLGYSRQRIPGNWKLMQENIKDPYHPGLLHTWFVVFGLWRADQKSQLVTDALRRHAVMVSQKNDGGKGAVTQGVSSFKESMSLEDPRVLDVVPEPWWGGPTVTMLTLFPSVIIQQQVNSVSTRHIIPRGNGEFDFWWTHFGYEDDTPEMTRRRLRQGNLFGPAGYVSADDGEVIEMQQAGFRQHPDHHTVSELGGLELGGTDHNVSETLIRGMYDYWRKVMAL